MKKYITCLSIAGSDPSGGAGIEADLKTFAALGTYGMAVITAVTAQNTIGVRASFALPADMVAAQIEAVFDDIHPQYVKIGMLANVEIIETISALLKRYVPKVIILDPVMVSTSGHKLISDNAITTLQTELLPLATLVTPNLPECAVLAGTTIPRTLDDAKTCGEIIMRKNTNAVLIKGGHSMNNVEAVDLLITPYDCRFFTKPRIDTRNTHGTGCTLSSAITAYMARGLNLYNAIASAKAYLHKALEAGKSVEIGEGHGPVCHFFAPEKQRFK